MKKTLLALALTVLAAPAFSTEVQLYGAVDEFVAVNNTQGSWRVGLMSGGVTASYWGIKGTEDLGNGIEAFFTLDNAFYADDGALVFNNETRAFSREANLGIRGKYASFSFGRQYTPHFLVFAFLDPTDLSLGSAGAPFFFPGPASAMGADGGLVRADNSFLLTVPTPIGLTNFFYLALGEHQGADGGQDSNKLGNIYNYAAKFDYGNFSMMLSYLYRNVALTTSKYNSFANQYINFAASYDFGFTKPVFQYTQKFTSDKVQQNAFFLFQLGTSTPLWGGKWMISGAYLHNQTVKKADAWTIGTKYVYPLSKRTRLYGGLQLLFNGRRSGYAIVAGSDSSLPFHFDANTMVSGYGTDYLGKNVQQLFVGINHQF